MNNMEICLSGVGGQGIGLLTEVLVRSCAKAGYTVKGCDTHGLAQRGGTVMSHLRIGEKVYVPRVSAGEADLVISLERLEAYRSAVAMLKPGGTLLYYDAVYQPIDVRMGKSSYPDARELDRFGTAQKCRVYRVFQADLPDPKMQNVALLAEIVRMKLIPGVTREVVEGVLREVIPARAMEPNLAVFKKTIGVAE